MNLNLRHELVTGATDVEGSPRIAPTPEHGSEGAREARAEPEGVPTQEHGNEDLRPETRNL